MPAVKAEKGSKLEDGDVPTPRVTTVLKATRKVWVPGGKYICIDVETELKGAEARVGNSLMSRSSHPPDTKPRADEAVKDSPPRLGASACGADSESSTVPSHAFCYNFSLCGPFAFRSTSKRNSRHTGTRPACSARVSKRSNEGKSCIREIPRRRRVR